MLDTLYYGHVQFSTQFTPWLVRFFEGKILRSSGLFRDYSTSSWLLGGWGRALERRLSSLESGLLRDYSMIIDDVKMVGPRKKRDKRSFFWPKDPFPRSEMREKKSPTLPFFHDPVIIHDYWKIIKRLLYDYWIFWWLLMDYSEIIQIASDYWNMVGMGR